MLSFLYPVFNRAGLLARTLDTFVLQQNPGDYEILILDDGSTDHVQDVVRYYGQESPFRLPLRYFRLDVGRREHVTDNLGGGHLITKVTPLYRSADGANNPTVAWNVGIQQARGRWVAISSPEICHRSVYNVALLNCYRPETVAIVADGYDRHWAATEFGGWIGGGPAQRSLCFLARFDRGFLLRIGGFEEAFMAGLGYDDNEFSDRFLANGGSYEFTGGAVVAEHLPHPRPEPSAIHDVNRQVWERVRGQRVANVGREWGSAACIVEAWP